MNTYGKSFRTAFDSLWIVFCHGQQNARLWRFVQYPAGSTLPHIDGRAILLEHHGSPVSGHPIGESARPGQHGSSCAGPVPWASLA